MIKFLLFAGGVLAAYLVMYDRCIHKKGWWESVKDLTIGFFVSPLFICLFRIVATCSIFYLIYALMHNTSLF